MDRAHAPSTFHDPGHHRLRVFSACAPGLPPRPAALGEIDGRLDTLTVTAGIHARGRHPTRAAPAVAAQSRQASRSPPPTASPSLAAPSSDRPQVKKDAKTKRGPLPPGERASLHVLLLWG
jgi:hypothetical protein